MSLKTVMFPNRGRSSKRVMLLRHGPPLLLVIAAVVLIILGHGQLTGVSDDAGVSSGSNVFTGTSTGTNSMLCAIGVGALITAAMVWLFGWFVRLSIESGDDRNKEEADREYFTRTGRWPGERGPG